MGACACKDANSRNIDSKMKENQKYENSLVKLLFLGPGGSGKSTIFKQLQWLHGDGFSKIDVLDLKQYIYQQIISQMQDAIKNYLKETIDDEKLQKAIDATKQYDSTEILTQEIASNIQFIWKNDERLQEIFQIHHTKKVLDESTEYFWDSIERILTANYEPTQTDILNIRNRTTGLIEKKFTIKNCNFHIFDVGGQKSERKKWIQCFDKVRAVIFVVGLSCYNEMMYEDETKNAMDDAIELFDKTVNNSHFINTPIILFLNKKDLFEIKIKDLPITVCPTFDDFDKNNDPIYINNNPNDYMQATTYIEKKFEEVNKSTNKRKIYCHLTCAVDNKNVETVFNDVICIVMQEIKNMMSSARII